MFIPTFTLSKKKELFFYPFEFPFFYKYDH